MGVWDVLRGQARPRPAKLDQLFAVPSAALSLESTLGLRPTGAGSVCFRVAPGAAADMAQQEAAALVGSTAGAELSTHVDQYGYTWASVRTDPPDTGMLVTQLHAVNLALEAQGFGPGLLCSVVDFTDAAAEPCYIVYLYKRGNFYPFCPVSGTTRNDLRERQVRDVVQRELSVEPDPARWMPIWGIQAR